MPVQEGSRVYELCAKHFLVYSVLKLNLKGDVTLLEADAPPKRLTTFLKDALPHKLILERERPESINNKIQM
jgi:hypothetical protein